MGKVNNKGSVVSQRRRFLKGDYARRLSFLSFGGGFLYCLNVCGVFVSVGGFIVFLFFLIVIMIVMVVLQC